MTTGLPDLHQPPRVVARNLYWMGWRVARIAEALGEPANTIHAWKRRDGWDESDPLQRVETVFESRLIQLTLKEPKEGKDYKEIDLLGRQMERMARVRRYEQSGNEADLNPNRSKGGKARGKPKRNALTEEQVARVSEAFWESLYGHQKIWYRAGLENRIRNILKARQIGATLYFAREAIVDALETGKNKIFLSASKAQAQVFRNYIINFVREVVDVDLKGGLDTPMILENGAELYFLGTNSSTAQSYHGDVYLDEYFWIHRFQQFRRVTSGMAAHKKWRQTYFSTPSSIAHEAYPFWSGDLFNQRRPKGERAEFDVSHAALQEGRRCADNHWRQIVTIHDAEAAGFDLFDLEQLKLEYGPEEFANLFLCEFIDDTLSAFPLSTLQPCMVDSWEDWDDVRPFAPRPVGDAPVWIGYDPSGDGEDGDGAGVGVSLPPAKPGGKHRVLERHRLHGQDYEAQAAFIEKLTKTYSVQHIGIDVTGMGEAVAQLVEKFFPAVTRYRYTPEVKARMVLKTQQMMRKGRLEWDAGWSDLAQSFMAIRRTMTAGGRQVTYQAGRNADTGHAELAWAVMHALDHEAIDAPAGGGRSILEISG